MSNDIFSQKPIDKYRQADHKIDEIFLSRWSPRAFSDKNLEEKIILRVLEAARFAPSAFNEQPWRFIYSVRPDQGFYNILESLVEFNQVWAKKAGALIVFLSKKNFSHNNQINQTASFDTGAAWQNLALQARALNLVAHAMSGLGFKKLREKLSINDNYSIMAVIALGWPGDLSSLSKELQEREEPSDRIELKKIVKRDKFNF